MNVVLARLVFLAFLAMSGSIIYNALYLQDLRGLASLPPTAPVPAAAPAPRTASVPQAASVEVMLPPVSTDLPPLSAENGGSLLVVRAVQRELAARGYDVGETDGTLSVKTRAAISIYESREGLPVTGIATDELLHHILLGGSAKPADTGSADAGPATPTEDESATVMAVQQILADLGYDPGTPDGAIGSSTSAAISAFQRDRNISETGHISPELLDQLKRVTGRDLTKTAAKP
ncbi:MAG: peptidoglycan-binding protein [Methyloceanibacter sp.]|nr:peptidoglycan-binding protein [Methyloceanibacter sp.]